MSAPLTFALDRAALRAVLLFAGKDDIRHYLNGVLLDIRGSRIVMVGCDGHRCGIYRHPDEAVSQDGKPNADWMEIIMPRSMVEACTKGKATVSIVSVDFDPKTLALTAKVDGATYTDVAVEGKYPDYRKIVPQGALSDVPGQFQGAYVHDFSKADAIFATAAGKRLKYYTPCVHIVHGGEGSARIRLQSCPNNFVGVLMPYRTWAGAADDTAAWVQDRAP